jgi:hypothetical protein
MMNCHADAAVILQVMACAEHASCASLQMRQRQTMG